MDETTPLVPKTNRWREAGILISLILVVVVVPALIYAKFYKGREAKDLDVCLDTVEQIFVVNMDRCTQRRQLMRDALEVGNSSSPVSCVALRWGVGNADGTKKSREEIGQILGVPQMQDWPGGNPYHPGKHMARGEYGCAASHYLIYQEIVAKNLSAALVLEDDMNLTGSSNDLDHFVRALRQALSSLTAHSGPEGWDMLYLDYKNIMEKGADSINVIVPAGKSHPGLQHGGCLGYTSNYVLSQSGARKLSRFKEFYATHMIPIDDFFMSLGGRNCPKKYDRAAKLYADHFVFSPYEGLNVFSTVNLLSRQSNVFGSFTHDGDDTGQC